MMGKRPDDTDLPEGLRFLDPDEEEDPLEDESEEPGVNDDAALTAQRDHEQVHGHPALNDQ